MQWALFGSLLSKYIKMPLLKWIKFVFNFNLLNRSQKVPIEKAKFLELARTKWVKLESVIDKMKKLYVASSSPASSKKANKKHSLQEIIDNCNQNALKGGSQF
jgi:hypothetical protein